MPTSNTTSRNLIRTVVGTSIGVATALTCWFALFLLATIDDAAHWKGTLIASGILLPILCVAGGVIVSRANKNRMNYVVANIGFAFLATLLTTAALMALFSLTFWFGLLASIPIFFAWAFVEERYISATINSYVERLAGPPP